MHFWPTGPLPPPSRSMRVRRPAPPRCSLPPRLATAVWWTCCWLREPTRASATQRMRRPCTSPPCGGTSPWCSRCSPSSNHVVSRGRCGVGGRGGELPAFLLPVGAELRHLACFAVSCLLCPVKQCCLVCQPLSNHEVPSAAGQITSWKVKNKSTSSKQQQPISDTPKRARYRFSIINIKKTF